MHDVNAISRLLNNQTQLENLINKSCPLLIDPVREAPAAMGVAVSMSCVDEAVLEWTTDVVCRQPCYRSHHIPGELPDLKGALILTSPPIILCPETY